MIQQIIVLLVFLIAVGFVARHLYQSFASKKSCASGCGKCGAVDFSKIEKQLKERGI